MDHIGGVSANSNKEAPSLPPGFRFHPTDEELVSFYLANKIQNPNFSDHAISEADLNKCEPWELPGKARMGEKEWYFYSLKDRKYPTGVRTNRATHAGYWKATGKDREVMGSQAPLKGKLVGMKKTLVFYQGRAPKGTKSNWVMHEYRAEDALKHSLKCKSSKDEWVLCRVFHKTPGGKKMTLTDLQIAMALIGGNSSNNADARIEKMAATLPALREVQWNTPTTQASISYMSGQNVPSNTLGQGQACSYLTGQNVPSNTLGQGQARSYLSGQGTGQGVYGQSVYATGQTSQNQLANLLNSLPETGNSVFKSLFHYNEQVNSVKGGRREDCQVPVMEELEVGRRPANLQVPVSMWEELQVGGQNVKPMLTCGRPSPDSCISTLECAPSSHLLNNYMHHPLPSDLESFWLY